MTRKHFIIICSLLALCAVLATAFAFEAEREAAAYKKALGDAHEGALLSALSHMERLQNNIGKAVVSQDEGHSAKLLGAISADAAAVRDTLSSLPLSHAAMADAVKMCNQINDYTASLLVKAGASLSREDAQSLENLAGACDSLLQSLQSAWHLMNEGGLAFTAQSAALRDMDASQPVESAAQGAQYPTLIYDGPFSDALDRGPPLALGERRVTDAQAMEIALQFVGEGAIEARLTQPSGGDIPAYGVCVTTQDVALQLAVTQQGGNILWMFPEKADFDTIYGLPECRAAAEQFLAGRDYPQMRLTFWQMYGGMAILSYAAVQDGALLYPDLVKLQVRLDTLAVVGAEARHYLTNHHKRAGLTPAISLEEAQGALSDRLTITSSQLCVIPVDGGEALCWEFKGDYGGQTYFIYIDARTGRQRDIQRLVQTAEGLRAG